MQYCSLQHQTLHPSPVTSTTGCCFHFGSISSFFLVISPMISSSILGTYRPGEFIFHCRIFLPFHTIHGILKARLLKRFAIPFCSGPCFVRTLHHDLGWPLYGMAHSFIHKAVIHVISLVVFSDYGFPFVCPLMDKDQRLVEVSWWKEMKQMFFWNSLVFCMMQWVFPIWSLIPLPFLNPAWTTGNSWFM